MKFTADKIAIRGPLVDGGFSVTLSVGEYERAKMAQLLMLPADENIRVTIEGEKE